MKIYCFLSLEQHGIPVFCCYPYLFSIRSGRLFHMPTKVAGCCSIGRRVISFWEAGSSKQPTVRVEILLSAVVCSYLRCVWKTLDAVLALQAYYQQLIAVKEASDVGVLTALNFLCRLIVVLLWVSVPSVFFSTTGEKKSTGRACF